MATMLTYTEQCMLGNMLRAAADQYQQDTERGDRSLERDYQRAKALALGWAERIENAASVSVVDGPARDTDTDEEGSK